MPLAHLSNSSCSLFMIGVMIMIIRINIINLFALLVRHIYIFFSHKSECFMLADYWFCRRPHPHPQRRHRRRQHRVHRIEINNENKFMQTLHDISPVVFLVRIRPFRRIPFDLVQALVDTGDSEPGTENGTNHTQKSHFYSDGPKPYERKTTSRLMSHKHYVFWTW